MEDTSTSKVVTERVFFIVDRTRLKDEKDELKNAIVVYIPEKDLSKVREKNITLIHEFTTFFFSLILSRGVLSW